MQRYRLIEEETGRDLGPYASPRIVLQVGETLARRPAERYQITKVIPAEADEPFCAYLVVRALGGPRP